MAVPALKIDGAAALLARLARARGRGGLGAGRARAGRRARLLERGAPVRRDEYWRFTDPAG